MEIRQYFHKSRRVVKSWFDKYKLVKSKEQKNEVRKRKYLKEFGSTNIWDKPGYREKITKIFQEKFGSDSPFQNKDIQNKAKENYNKFRQDKNKEENRLKKIQETNKKKYGCWNSQKHLPKETLTILENKEKFKDYILSLEESNRTIYFIAENLKVHHTNISQKIIKYDLKTLIKYNTMNESKQHKEIQDLLDSWNIEYFSNNKDILEGKEIDIWIPSKNIGIEFNGDHWHTVNQKGKDYHQKKSLLAENKKIFLYHIFEYEWDQPFLKNKIINQLKNLLGLNDNRVYARQCEIKNVSIKETKEFLNQNHLQGADRSSVKLGLYSNNELVAIMTFCKPRFNKKFEWELSRFCCKANTSVIGGASRLFKHFIKNNSGSILSYSDISHTKGGLYEQLGFKLDHISSPNYVWIKNHKVLTRYQCQRYKLINQFPELDGLTETEIMTYLGYEKLEDSGNKVWYYYN